MKILFLVLVVLILTVLTGCNAAAPKCEPTIQLQPVERPVAVPCVLNAPVRPLYHFGEGGYPGDVIAAKVVADDFEAAKNYALAWEAATIGCTINSAPAPASPLPAPTGHD